MLLHDLMVVLQAVGLTFDNAFDLRWGRLERRSSDLYHLRFCNWLLPIFGVYLTGHLQR